MYNDIKISIQAIGAFEVAALDQLKLRIYFYLILAFALSFLQVFNCNN